MKGGQMSINKIRSGIPILCIALLISAVLAAGQMPKAQDKQPPPDDVRKQADNLKRLITVMGNSAQIPQVNPAATLDDPTSPIAQASYGRLRINVDEYTDLHIFFDAVASGLGIIPLTVDSNIKGTIDISTSTPLSKDDVFLLFLCVLKNNSVALIRDKENYKIVPISGIPPGGEIVDKLPDTSISKSEPARLSANDGDPIKPGSSQTPLASPIIQRRNGRYLTTHIVQVKFVSVKDLIEAIKPFITQTGSIRLIERVNMLILTDYADNWDKIRQTIQLLDINAQSTDNREVTSFIGQESERKGCHEAGRKIVFSCATVSAAKARAALMSASFNLG
jgi:type II secretory pathway component GspD/PulD (secretin)